MSFYILSPLPSTSGGLGTTTAPTAGQIPIGNANGTYTPGPISSAITGILPTANGGTGLGGATPFTANGVMYASSASVLATGSALTFDGTSLALGRTALAARILTVQGRACFTASANDSQLAIYSDGSTNGIYSTYNSTGSYLPMTFYINDVEQMRLTGTGLGIGTSSPAYKLDVAGLARFNTTLSVGNAVPSSSGSGITFPATQSASTDANTLDDYEEGTFTPSLTNFTVVGTPTHTGFYTKVGRQVTVVMQLSASTSISSTASSFVNNLPFPVSVPSIGSMATMTDNSGVGSASNGYATTSSCYPGTSSATAYKYITVTYFTS